ncbi:MAG: DNA alkylation repair protein [Alistipes sp.]
MTCAAVTDYLHTLADEKFRAGMSRFGISTSRALGIRTPLLRATAKQIGYDTPLARQLYQEPIHEAKILEAV